MANRPLGAIFKRERDKNNLYLHSAQILGALFFPLVFDTYGTFGPSAISFISKLAEEATASAVSQLDDQPIKSYLHGSLSFMLQIGNANILLSGSRLSRARVRNLIQDL